MEKTIIYQGTEVKFSTCTFANNDGERVDGLHIHDMSDEYGNGDCVVGNCAQIPEYDEDVEAIYSNEFLDSDCNTLETVIFTE